MDIPTLCHVLFSQSGYIVAAAIANAVADASSGARVTNLPITDEKVYRACEASA
jgi:hypothetical protein